MLTVIERKADTGKHESAGRDQYADCAVDGIWLHARFLPEEYDVPAVAFSGETQQRKSSTVQVRYK